MTTTKLLLLSLRVSWSRPTLLLLLGQRFQPAGMATEPPCRSMEFHHDLEGRTREGQSYGSLRSYKDLLTMDHDGQGPTRHRYPGISSNSHGNHGVHRMGWSRSAVVKYKQRGQCGSGDDGNQANPKGSRWTLNEDYLPLRQTIFKTI